MCSGANYWVDIFKEVWYNKNLSIKFLLNFPQLLNIGNYVKVKFNYKGLPYYFLSSRGQKIFILGFIFYGFSRAKTDLHNQYMI